MNAVIDVIANANNPIPVRSTEDLPIDLLNRQEIINQCLHLLKIISDNRLSSTFALNGAWGTGKTFVLNRLMKQLLDYQDGEKFFVFHYNCWQYDFYDEPLVAIVAAFLDSVDQENHLFSDSLREKAKQGMSFAKPILEKIAKDFIKKKIGIDVADLLTLLKDSTESLDSFNESIEDMHDYDKFFSFKKAITSAQESLLSLTQNRTVVVIVDELDRCLPSYTIKVLERLHHLFSGLDNCAIILAVDKSQLECTVHQIFGMDTNPSQYLKKFINFEIQLNMGKIENGFLVKYADYFSLFENPFIDTKFSCEKFFSAIFTNIDMRTQERIMDRIQTIHRLLFPDVKKDYAFMCTEVIWLIFTEYRKLNIKMPIVYDGSYDRQYFCIPGNSFSEFSEYMKTEWLGINLQDIPVHGNSKPACYFRLPLDIPQIIVWYLWQMYPESSRSYQIDSNHPQIDIYKQNLRDLKKFASMLTVIT